MSRTTAATSKHAASAAAPDLKLAFKATYRRELEQRSDCPSADACLWAAAHASRELLAERWIRTQAEDRANTTARRVHYLSMEFLMGRALGNALAALGLDDALRTAIEAAGQSLPDVLEREADAALGNGGLGRLAACFLDSLATLGLPSFGYGMRYEYGMFAQQIAGGRQVENPDHWLKRGNPWEFPRPELHYPVRFGGWVECRGRRAVLGAGRAHRRQGLRHRRPRPRHRARGHAAPVECQRRAPDRPCRLLPRRLPASGRERLAENISMGAVPQRQHARRPRAAPEAGVLLRQRLDAGHAGAPPARARALDNLAARARSTSTTPTRPWCRPN